MQLGRVIGTVTGTTKDRALTGHKLLVVELLDSASNVIESGRVAVDAAGAGFGDTVVVTSGSAARQTAGTTGVPTDLTIVMIVEELTVGGSKVPATKKGK